MQDPLTIHDLHILLVEPSHAQSRIIIRHLTEAGLDKTDVATTGAEALERMHAHRPDLVISAMYFHDMTGTELITAMREDPQLAEIPFMLVSSERHPHNLEPIRQAGVLAVLPKPFPPDTLQKALYATLDYVEPAQLELENLDVEELRVLVVDDSRFSLHHITRMLEQMGVEAIEQASDGVEAAEKIRDQQFDLVITDYDMPEMDGQQLVNYVRQASDQPDLPILMVTSITDETRLASVRQSGVSALCDKPFTSTNIRQLMQRLLSH